MKSDLKNFHNYLYNINRNYSREVPSASATHAFVDNMVNFLFPIRVGWEFKSEELRQKLDDLKSALEKLLSSLRPVLKEEPSVICNKFYERLPDIFEMLLEDADAFTKFDPASESVEEVILCYPGFFSIVVYRLAHELHSLKVPVLPRIMTEYAHSKTGVDIHPGARIGKRFFIDHATGVVIGETTEIGNNVKLYQGITLGALFVEKELANKKRHPTIEDNVIIYARATILGGETVIGHDTVIGGNVWLTESVAPYSVVYQKHNAVIRDSKNIQDQINWTI
jgi:serine O-acetyltransferase